MPSSPSTGRRVLIIGSDGMRPDAITPERMPTYSRLIGEGTLFKRFHAAYPSETRVSMTTLTTGVYPGRHGVIANWLHLPRFGEKGLQTGDHQQLLDYTRQTGEQLVLSPTLGDRLAVAGMELGVAGASSPGAGLLWNIRRPGQVININTSYGVPGLEAIHRKVGPAPGKEQQRERLEWAVKALLEVALPDPRNRALVLWMPQPDKASHDHGLGSPEFCEALGWVDACVAQVLEEIEKRGEEIDVFFISDHGHSTVDAQGPLSEHLAQACRERGIDMPPLDVTGKMIHAKAPIADEALRELIAWLKTEPWCGSILAHHPLAREWGALPMETLYGPLHHQRAPLLVVNPTWSPECNEAGVPGIVRFPMGAKSRSTHGNAVPTDMSAFCLGYGPSFRAGAVSDVPCGIVDIAPTVCHLLGLEGETGFDGRVLHEGLSGSGSLPPPESRFEIHGKGTQRQPIRTAEVNGTRYVLGSELE